MKNKEIGKRVSQLLMMGIASLRLTQEEKFFIKKHQIGGIILFSRNYSDPEQLVDLINDINSLYKETPPFLAVDQEGGSVIRFKKPFTQFPGNDYLGRYYERTESLDLVREYAEVTAKELRAFGVNVCLSPVADILTNPENKVIGKRAFSKDPLVVSAIAKTIIEEFRKNGIIACAKHFPGHGDTTEDSHEELPVVNHNLDFLRDRELAPFRAVIETTVPMIMTSHILYKEIDPKYPVTLSKTLITDLLRNEMWHNNLVISDDFEMQGLSKNYDLDEAAVLALNAGVDIVLVCHCLGKVEKVYERLIREIGERPDFSERIGESFERVLKIKNDFSLSLSKINYKKAMGAFDYDRSSKLIKLIEGY